MLGFPTRVGTDFGDYCDGGADENHETDDDDDDVDGFDDDSCQYLCPLPPDDQCPVELWVL